MPRIALNLNVKSPVRKTDHIHEDQAEHVKEQHVKDSHVKSSSKL